MLIFRFLIPTLFVLAGVFFAMFMFTGNPRYKRLGLGVLAGTLICTFGFFAVLIAINLLE